jgi:putative transposase
LLFIRKDDQKKKAAGYALRIRVKNVQPFFRIKTRAEFVEVFALRLLKKQLVLDALATAYWQRKPLKGLLHHSDRGSQYASYDYRDRLESYGMQASMSRKGNCWDNTPTERFFRSLKSERIAHYRFFTQDAAKNEILDYITFYSSIRLHSTLGYLSPMDYEKEQYLKVA